MMIKFKVILAGLLLIGGQGLFAAITPTISINTGSGVTQVDVDGMKAEINSAYQTSAQSQIVDFLNAMAAAQAIGNSGFGTDYSSNKSLFVVGGGANLGFNPGNNSLSNLGAALENAKGLPSLGIAAQIGGYVGLSLSKFPVPTIGPIDLKNMTVFVNFAGYDLDQVKPYTIKTGSFGLHVQYKLIQPKSMALGFLNWGGLDITTGFDISSNKYAASGTLPEQKYGVLTWKPTGTLAINNSAFVIPIEASTNVRVLYILSLIGGGAVDIMAANSELAAAVSGNVTGTVGTTTVNAGSASITGSETGKSSAVGIRGFAGFAINLVPLKSTNVLSLVVIGNAGTAGYGAKIGIQGAW